ncbi:hypothetical protein [Pseudomonas sp. TH10]|uniref:hypothetical protein n=1 Tax=Pseudomonas sp. TH10 TaxID=2796376 RepID=UPI00191459A0|nr:hypothetical protein [Pseudomonas sp. TH10]MBK5518063.1 hypothetical protein [Pseudomonas sp. TH10]
MATKNTVPKVHMDVGFGRVYRVPAWAEFSAADRQLRVDSVEKFGLPNCLIID